MADGYSFVESALAFEPAEGYAYLREQCPVHHVPEHDPPFYVVSRFDDVIDTLKKPGVWGNWLGSGVFKSVGGTLGSADDPDHSRHRGVLRHSFLPSQIAKLESAVTARCDELLNEVLPAGGGDFVTEFAFPFPALAIGELLGVRPEDREMFGQLSAVVVAALTGGDFERYVEARSALGDYIDARLAEREPILNAALRTAGLRSFEPPLAAPGEPTPASGASALLSTTPDEPANLNPVDVPNSAAVPEAADPLAECSRNDALIAAQVLPDDVLTVMLLARRDGRMSPDEVRHTGHQLLVAGHETTTSLLGLMLYRLLERPELMARLRADHSLIPVAIEEALRFDSPVNGLFRASKCPVDVHGTHMEPETKMGVLYGSANRDPSRFVNPDVFNIDRPRNELGRHVAFGWGVHFCIGAPLARLEARIAFERLLTRTTSITLAGTPTRNTSFVLHGLTHLPLTWTMA